MRTEALIRIASGIRGTVTTVEDAGYDEARRVWNGTVDKRPELVVSCVDTADVIEAIS